MNKKIIIALLVLFCCSVAAPAQPLAVKGKITKTKKVSKRLKKPVKRLVKKPVNKAQVKAKQLKAQIAKLQKDNLRLKKRLSKARAKQLRSDILDKINVNQAKMAALKKKLYPPKTKPKPKKEASLEAVVAPTPETSLEGLVSAEAGAAKERIGGVKPEIGAVYGLFAGATTFLGEARLPLRFIFGPATTAVRLAAGLAQSRDTTNRYVPVNLDLVFNFPPGWFSGVENYIGFGLNYVALMTGHQPGTAGGELFYGVVSDGFGGIVFGELGYAALRGGTGPSQKGTTVLVGYRHTIF